MSNSLADLFFARQASKGSDKHLEVSHGQPKSDSIGKTLKLFTRTAAEDGEAEPQVKLSALEREQKMREEDRATRQSRVAKFTNKDAMALQQEEMTKTASDLAKSGHEFTVENDQGESIKFDSSMWK